MLPRRTDRHMLLLLFAGRGGNDAGHTRFAALSGLGYTAVTLRLHLSGHPLR